MSDALLAVSPIDGRYRSVTTPLSDFFSEFALIRYRVRVELLYFRALQRVPQISVFAAEQHTQMDELLQRCTVQFSLDDAMLIKRKEQETNHDVKAVEYFLREQLYQHFRSLEPCAELIHFGLTSQDINNTAIPMMIRDSLDKVWLPQLRRVIQLIEDRLPRWKIPMLARTHGQPASPTSLGKEYQVWMERLQRQIELLLAIPHSGKFGGATGNFNAHVVAYPTVDWRQFANEFCVRDLGLQRQQFTTQVEHYDELAARCDAIRRIHVILLDFCRDTWQYVSLGYFKLRINDEREVGSSTMPHKVNPIDFENAEGNLGLANAFLQHFAEKLPISRLQRDLSDSTVLRNLGVPLGHSLIALGSIARGIEKVEPNRAVLEADLENNWAVVAEGVQTVLRREGFQRPFEMLKELIRHSERVTENTIQTFIDQLDIPDAVKDELRHITPLTFTGYA